MVSIDLNEKRLFGRTCLRCDLFLAINGMVDSMVCRCERPEPDSRQPNHWLDGTRGHYDPNYDGVFPRRAGGINIQ